jgi:hypothetical protein
MTDTTKLDRDPEQEEREQHAVELLPVLQQLEGIAKELDGGSATGAQVAAYEATSAHARHLAGAAGLTEKDLPAGYSRQGWDHAQAPQAFTPVDPAPAGAEQAPPGADPETVRDLDDEEIGL